MKLDPRAFVLLAMTVGAGAWMAHNASERAEAERVQAAEREAFRARIAPQRTPTVLEALNAATTLDEALAICLPLMGDSGVTTNAGTALFAGWAAKHMRPEDVTVATDEPTTERGQRMCATGTVSELISSPTITRGTLKARDREVSFLAVGGQEKLQIRSPARVCGIVTGMLYRATQVVGFAVAR